MFMSPDSNSEDGDTDKLRDEKVPALMDCDRQENESSGEKSNSQQTSIDDDCTKKRLNWVAQNRRDHAEHDQADNQ